MSALLAVNWEWELRGTLIVIISVAVLCGSVYLILGTNHGVGCQQAIKFVKIICNRFRLDFNKTD